jgi:hypothetical protein
MGKIYYGLEIHCQANQDAFNYGCLEIACLVDQGDKADDV